MPSLVNRGSPDSRPVAIDLFCGAGGMSLGFEQAGFHVAAAFDSEQRHVETHRQNFPKTQVHIADLSKISGEYVLKVAGLPGQTLDVLFGGPPCQGFSLGGRRDLSDPRNSLILHFARLLREIRPRYFVVENVEGLLVGDAIKTVESFKRRVRRAGYEVVEPTRILDAADYGVPQRRRRLFIIGYREGLPAPSYPVPRGCVRPNGAEYVPSVWDAIGDLPSPNGSTILIDGHRYVGTLGPPSHYASILRGDVVDPSDKAEPRMKSESGLTGFFRTAHSPKTVNRFAKTKRGAAEPVSRYSRLDPDGLSPTLRSGTGPDHGSHTAPRPIHPVEPRCITVREAARLQSFPDWFQFHPTRWHAFRQIGNSVPPRMARAVAGTLIQSVGPEPSIVRGDTGENQNAA